MLFLIQSTLQQGVQFNIPTDVGAIGTYATPIYLPANSTPILIIYKVNTAVVGTGASRIQLQDSAGNPICGTATFNLNTVAAGKYATDSAAGSINPVNAGQLFIVVSGAAYTAGQASIYVQYTTIE